MNQLRYAVCEEAPVDLVVNGKTLATFMCTPEHLNELAIGYLYGRGLLHSVDEVYTLAACDDMRKVYVKTGSQLSESEYSLAGVLASGCGSGMVFTGEFYQQKRIETDMEIEPERLQQLVREMFDTAHLYKETGGLHCAALSDGEKLLALREDVGRHNAIDKVLGKGLFLGVDFKRSALLTTGRISSDMVLKAVAGGVPIVASRSIPTTLALEIAEVCGITVVGRVISKSPVIYTHPDRIVGAEVVLVSKTEEE